jgi:hypothetical protein
MLIMEHSLEHKAPVLTEFSFVHTSFNNNNLVTMFLVLRQSSSVSLHNEPKKSIFMDA